VQPPGVDGEVVGQPTLVVTQPKKRRFTRRFLSRRGTSCSPARQIRLHADLLPRAHRLNTGAEFLDDANHLVPRLVLARCPPRGVLPLFSLPRVVHRRDGWSPTIDRIVPRHRTNTYASRTATWPD
jgi:hypothetical protein